MAIFETNITKNINKTCNINHNNSFFSIWKSLGVLQKACGLCYYTYLSFSYTYNLLFCCKIKIYCDHCFPQQIRPQTIVQLCILQQYSGVKIGFNMNKKSVMTYAFACWTPSWKLAPRFCSHKSCERGNITFSICCVRSRWSHNQGVMWL